MTFPNRYAWSEEDVPTSDLMNVYLQNVSVLRSVLAVMESTPEVPTDVVAFMIQDANDIEKIIEDINLLLTGSAQAWYYSDDMFSGEG